MSNEKVLIIGCDGQDGRILRSRLAASNTSILGLRRGGVVSFSAETDELAATVRGEVLLSPSGMYDLFSQYQPTKVFYLAAYHTSSEVDEPESNSEYEKYHNVHVVGLINVLNSIRDLSLSSKVFYAASALMFDADSNGTRITENCRFSPVGYYGITKAQGVMVCDHYRRKYAIFAAAGYLYNHESHLRPSHFLSKKVIETAYRISRGSAECLTVGNLSSIVDWGYADDYVAAFQKILDTAVSDNYVVATGEGHSVGDFVSTVFDFFKISMTKHVREDLSIQKRQTPPRIGDPTKLIEATGWRPTFTFEQMIAQLINDYINGLTPASC